MDKIFILKMCGFYNLLFALFHLSFWKIFKWKKDLKSNSIANRAIIQILNIRLIYIFLLMSVLYLFYTDQMISTTIGYALMIGFTGFWIGRTVEQFVFLSVKSQMVTILSIIFMLGIVIHVLPLLL